MSEMQRLIESIRRAKVEMEKAHAESRSKLLAALARAKGE